MPLPMTPTAPILHANFYIYVHVNKFRGSRAKCGQIHFYPQWKVTKFNHYNLGMQTNQGDLEISSHEQLLQTKNRN